MSDRPPGFLFHASSEHIKRALRPKIIRTNPAESFVYVILKRFKPYFDAPEQNLVKVGTSNVSRDASRLGELQTALISFHVLRIYLYRPYEIKGKALGSEKGDTFGRQAEQYLHKTIMENAKKFGSTFSKVRLRFPVLNDDDDRRTGNMSEWFNIPPSKLSLFLKLCDDTLLYNHRPPPLSASKFDRKGQDYIDLDDVPPQVIGIRYVRGEARQSETARETNSYLGDHQRSRRAMDGQRARDKIREIIEKKHRDKLRGTVEFWRDKLLGIKFREDELSSTYQLRVDNVFYDKTYRQILVTYEPIPRITVRKLRKGTKKVTEKISSSALEENSGMLTINEVLLYSNRVRKPEFRDSYVYYSRLNGFEPDVDYTLDAY